MQLNVQRKGNGRRGNEAQHYLQIIELFSYSQLAGIQAVNSQKGNRGARGTTIAAHQSVKGNSVHNQT
jgi:hypothetical protein